MFYTTALFGTVSPPFTLPSSNTSSTVLDTQAIAQWTDSRNLDADLLFSRIGICPNTIRLPYKNELESFPGEYRAEEVSPKKC